MSQLALFVYRTLLSLYPRRFRAQFEAEMLLVFQEKLAESTTVGKWLPLVALLQELRDWPANCLQAHWQGRQKMNLPFKRIAKWTVALLALIVVIVWLRRRSRPKIGH